MPVALIHPGLVCRHKSGGGIPGYNYSVPITISNTITSADQFNVTVYLSGGQMPGGASGLWSNCQSLGQEIRFTTDAAGSNLIPFENVVATFSTGGQTCQIWVNVPHVSSSTPTVIYMWYGNPTAPALSKSDPNGQYAVWNNVTASNSAYSMVFHFEDLAGYVGGLVADSTGVQTSPRQNAVSSTTGEIAACGSFSAGYIDCAQALSITSPFSMTVWAQTTSAAAQQTIIGNYSGAGGYLLAYYSGYLQYYNGAAFYSATQAADTNMDYLGCTYNGSNLAFYINGVQKGTPVAGSTVGSSFPTRIGSNPNFASQFTGKIDEVRVGVLTLSSSWIAMEFLNQSAPGTYITAGTPVHH
jgi:hypothetical protein